MGKKVVPFVYPNMEFHEDQLCKAMLNIMPSMPYLMRLFDRWSCLTALQKIKLNKQVYAFFPSHAADMYHIMKEALRRWEFTRDHPADKDVIDLMYRPFDGIWKLREDLHTLVGAINKEIQLLLQKEARPRSTPSEKEAKRKAAKEEAEAKKKAEEEEQLKKEAEKKAGKPRKKVWDGITIDETTPTYIPSPADSDSILESRIPLRRATSSYFYTKKDTELQKIPPPNKCNSIINTRVLRNNQEANTHKKLGNTPNKKGSKKVEEITKPNIAKEAEIDLMSIGKLPRAQGSKRTIKLKVPNSFLTSEKPKKAVKVYTKKIKKEVIKPKETRDMIPKIPVLNTVQDIPPKRAEVLEPTGSKRRRMKPPQKYVQKTPDAAKTVEFVPLVKEEAMEPKRAKREKVVNENSG